MCDIGNKCDVDEADIVEYFLEDPETNVLALHLEDVKDGRKFIKAAQRFSASKPLVVFKAARTEPGGRASASHTGSLRGNDRVFEGALKQAGALRVHTWREFWDVPKAFAYQPLPAGNRLGIASHSGEPVWLLLTPRLKRAWCWPDLTPDTLTRLAGLSPRLARNPADLGPVLSPAADPFLIQEQAIAAVLEDSNVDLAFIVLYVGVLAPVQIVADMFDRILKRIPKPLAIWVYGTRLSIVEEMCRALDGRGLPTYTDIETGIKALGLMVQYSKTAPDLSSRAMISCLHPTSVAPEEFYHG